MDKFVLDTLFNIFSLILGTISVLFCKRFACGSVEFYTKHFPSFLKRHYYDETMFQYSFLIGGVAFAIIGFLGLIGIIKYG
jgi:hypothetical protein